jgi:hypothetical protein
MGGLTAGMATTAAGASAGGLTMFQRASQFGIQTYAKLTDALYKLGLQAHHIIE